MILGAGRSVVAPFIEIGGRADLGRKIMISDRACLVFRSLQDIYMDLLRREADSWVWNVGEKSRWRPGVGWVTRNSGHGCF